MEHITILGSGGFGLSLALSAYRSGHAVKVWSKFPEELEAIRRDGEHKQKLPGVPIPSEITLTADLEAAISGADLVIFGIPSSCVTPQSWQPLICMHQWSLSIRERAWKPERITP